MEKTPLVQSLHVDERYTSVSWKQFLLLLGKMPIIWMTSSFKSIFNSMG